MNPQMTVLPDGTETVLIHFLFSSPKGTLRASGMPLTESPPEMTWKIACTPNLVEMSATKTRSTPWHRTDAPQAVTCRMCKETKEWRESARRAGMAVAVDAVPFSGIEVKPVTVVPGAGVQSNLRDLESINGVPIRDVDWDGVPVKKNLKDLGINDLPPTTGVEYTAPVDPRINVTIHDLKNNLQKTLKPGERCAADLSKTVDRTTIVGEDS